MTLKDRRRALMGAQADDTIAALDIPNGATVAMTPTSTIMFIKCFNTSDNSACLFLREQCLPSAYKMWDSVRAADYEGSNVDTYCTTTFYNSFPEHARDSIVDYALTVRYWTSTSASSSSTKTLQRKIFLPKQAWISNSGSVTAALKTHYGTTSADTARIAKTSNGTARIWWTADGSASSSYNTYFSAVAATGIDNTASVTASVYVRPMMAVKPNARFKLVDGVYRLV